MRTNILIPKKIKVGFQNRDDTYTKKLAYVIYIDEKGKVRQETSWEGWRDKKIDPEEYANEPISGFVLNKKVGGYSSGWNHRQTYTRVFDPRGFEFEITVPNLLYILENTNSIKGKGLEGEFVYAWSGKDLVLVPTGSPDYIEMMKFNEILHEKKYLKSKELKVGAKYIDKNNEEWIYMGRFDLWDTKYEHIYENDRSSYWGGQRLKETIINDVNKGKYYYFASKGKYSYNDEEHLNLLTLKSLGDRIIGVVEDECVENYSELFDMLEGSATYSPYDKSKDKWVSFTLEELSEHLKKYKKSGYRYDINLYDGNGKRFEFRYDQDLKEFYIKGNYDYRNSSYEKQSNIGTIEDLLEKYKPIYIEKYLKNDKLYKKEY